mgnify:CR=1 FL=1
MNQGPNICGDGKDMPEGYQLEPPDINLPFQTQSTTKYFLYGIDCQVFPCSPDGYDSSERILGHLSHGIYYIEYAGQRRYFFEKDVVIDESGNAILDGIIYTEI